MARYKGAVEQARQQLRDMGASASEARKRAPRLAELQQSAADQAEKPFPWLGAPSGDTGQAD